MLQGKLTLGGVDLFATYGVISVSLSEGMREEYFGVSRQVTEITSDNGQSYFGGIINKTISFTLYFAKETTWSDTQRKAFAKLLMSDVYQDLYLTDEPNIIYKVVANGEPKIILNSSDQGYIQVKFNTDAPHAWTPEVINNIDATLASVGVPVVLVVNNTGNWNDDYYPEVEFQTVGVTEFNMTQTDNGDLVFGFTGLYAGEVVYTDCDLKKVISDQPYPDKYRYANFNKNWVKLIEGNNTFEITTPSIVSIKTQYPIMI